MSTANTVEKVGRIVAAAGFTALIVGGLYAVATRRRQMKRRLRRWRRRALEAIAGTEEGDREGEDVVVGAEDDAQPRCRKAFGASVAPMPGPSSAMPIAPVFAHALGNEDPSKIREEARRAKASLPPAFRTGKADRTDAVYQAELDAKQITEKDLERAHRQQPRPEFDTGRRSKVLGDTNGLMPYLRSKMGGYQEPPAYKPAGPFLHPAGQTDTPTGW
jgi:hypothetical protein